MTVNPKRIVILRLGYAQVAESKVGESKDRVVECCAAYRLVRFMDPATCAQDDKPLLVGALRLSFYMRHASEIGNSWRHFIRHPGGSQDLVKPNAAYSLI